jgi:integrase/recombinase XerD
LEQRNCTHCGTPELKQFLTYLSNGHTEPGGRWGNPQLTSPMRPVSIKDYSGNLRSMFKWFVTEGYLEASPMESIPVPTVRANQIQPLSYEHVTALIKAAGRSTNPKRDTAIVLLLLDTGMRASELCQLQTKHLDLETRRCYILGKGNKYRSVFFGRHTAKALWQYLRVPQDQPGGLVFYGERGPQCREPLRPNGLLQLIHRLGRASGIKAVRCSPHSLRHTYAISFLRAGGNVFTLREALGHTNIQMTQKYVMVAEADVEAQSRLYSPMDRLAMKN